MPTYQPPTQTTATDLAPNADPFLLEKARCQSAGGVWDEKTKSCKFRDQAGALAGNITLSKPIVPQPTQPTTTGKPPQDSGVIRDTTTGKPTGFVTGKGSTFLGLDDATLQAVFNKNSPNSVNALGIPDVGMQRDANERQAQIQQVLAAAQAGQLSPEQLQAIAGANPDYAQALGAGVAGALPGFIGGLGVAGVGTLAGAAATGASVSAATAFLGPGALIAGGAAALGTFLIAARNNIASQQTEEFASDTEALRKGDRYLRSLITDTNQNPQNAPQNIALFYQTLNMIDAAHAKTWKDSQENLNTFLGKDGTVELARFEVFDATMRNYYLLRFQTALAQPDPTQILITNEDLQLEAES